MNKLLKNGVSQKDIDSAIMGMDFQLREVNRYYGPASILILNRALKGWTVGDECKKFLFPIQDFEKLKKKV